LPIATTSCPTRIRRVSSIIYPDRSSGFHFQLAPGLGAISFVEGDFISEDLGGLGFGVMAGAG
jgi:hypothetical protein